MLRDGEQAGVTVEVANHEGGPSEMSWGIHLSIGAKGLRVIHVVDDGGEESLIDRIDILVITLEHLLVQHPVARTVGGAHLDDGRMEVHDVLGGMGVLDVLGGVGWSRGRC